MNNELTAYPLGTWLWTDPEKWVEAGSWIKENYTNEEAYFSASHSYVNGLDYSSYVMFKHEEDYLVFRLKFPELFIDRLKPYVMRTADAILGIL